MSIQARRYDMFIARPAAEMEPDSPTSSRRRILPGPMAPWPDRSMRMVSLATDGRVSLPMVVFGDDVKFGEGRAELLDP